MADPRKQVVNLPGRDAPVEGTDPEPEDETPTPAPAPTPASIPTVPGRRIPSKADLPKAVQATVTARPVPQALRQRAQLPREPLPNVEAQSPLHPSGVLPTVTAGDGRKVAILCPFYKSATPLTMYSILGNWDRAQHGFLLNYGDGFIVHSRNRLAERFLTETNFEWGLFVDDDMVLPCGNSSWFRQATGWDDFPEALASVKAVDRLLSHGKSLVGALYFGRDHRGRGKPMFSEGFWNEAIAKESRNVKSNRGIRPTAWVGTGCLLVHRTVLESIRSTFTHLEPSDPKEPFRFFSPAPDGALSRLHATQAALADGNIELAKRLVSEALHPNAMVNAWSGEDVVFTTRARMAGHQPYVDFGCVCGHSGSAVWGPGNTGT